jgi:hypothetical protein
MDARRSIHVPTHQQPVSARLADEHSDGFFVIFSDNPGVSGAHMPEGMNSRCRLQLRVGTDLTLAPQLGVSHELIEATRRLHELHNEDDADGEEQIDLRALNWAPQMRELLAFRDVAALFGEHVAACNLLGQVHDPYDMEIVQRQLRSSFGELAPLALGNSRFLG